MNEPDSSCAYLQQQIDTLEMNCITEFKALANYQQDRALAPLIHRLDALEAQIAVLTKTNLKGD